ncbi:hypothetical protein T261_1628 [Streptomyces lydicus]|nr:hypothetical protein T261_1628 [Streptomyces lydicus]
MNICDLTAVIRQADPNDKAETYRRLGLQLSYAPGQQSVHVEITPDPHNAHTAHNDKTPRSQRDRGEIVGVRGGT